jgi:tetraacyldisaccharide 4'-kinase
MTPLEFLYFLGYSVKRHYALTNQKRLPNKVISIGNITLGGTGKTPAAMALARKAATMGFYPCILTRGYRGKAEGPCFVSKGDGPLIDAYQAGDEAMLMAETLREVAIVKGKNRYAAGMFAIANLKSDISNLESKLLFILDDGFQHWVLHRDKDILLIDGTSPYGNRKLFPGGPLREPLSAMKRADIIVITNSYSHCPNSSGDGCARDGTNNKWPNVESLTEEVKRYAASAPLFFAQHRPSSLIASSGNVFALSDMKNKKVFAFCGIGNPHSFKNTLLPLAETLTGFMIFRDHYQYSRTDFRMIADNAKRSGADWIVTTEKDIMRLRGFSMPDNLLALRIEFHVDDKFYAEVFDWRR